MHFPALTLAACAALLATITSLWLLPAVWTVALVIAVVLGYAAGVLHGPAAVWVAAFGVLVWLHRRNKASAGGGGMRAGLLASGILVLGILLGMHALPGFDNPLLIDDAIVATGATSYTLYFNFDKTLVGILLMGFGSTALLRSAGEWQSALRAAAPVIAINIVVAMALSMALGFVAFQPKWTGLFWSWAVVNLLLTCLSEEAFFRGFIQKEVSDALSRHRHGEDMAVAASAVLFGIAHFAGGWRYVLLATIAGAGYAIVYGRTRRIEMAMLAHFTLNAVHFLLFTYPQLAPSAQAG